MKVKHICSWQHQFTSKEMMSIEELHIQFVFFVAKLATGQETTLALTAGNMAFKLDKQDIKEGDC